MNGIKISIHLVLTLVYLSIVSVSCQAQREKCTDQLPNIILILADDLGAGDLGCTGHPYAKTPNIDKLASEGIRFTRAYMAASWCSPSRYALMRGLFPAREFYLTYDLPTDQPSVTSMLKGAGYTTAHFGKWHISNNHKDSPPPGEYGIDVNFTTQSSGPGWTPEQRSERYFRALSTDRYVDMAIDFIKNQKGNPFYINLWVHPTHSYIDPTPEQLKEYKGLVVDTNDFKSPYQREFLRFVAKHGDIDKAMQAYCADLSALDKAIGCLIDFLEDQGLKENTLIAFTSDNGPGPLTNQLYKKMLQDRYEEMPTLLNSVGSAGEFRERKLSVREGGIHTPFIIRWPACTPAGITDTATIISGVDWLPTLARLVGIEQPNHAFDGIDRSGAFEGKPQKRDNSLFWYESNGNAAILRDYWKGVLIDDSFCLYDLYGDTGESRNLVSDYPDQAKALREELESFMSAQPVPKGRIVRTK